MSKFFSKANIHNFLWALLGAFVLFLCGLAWNWWSGPNEVKIVGSNQSTKDTTITIIKFEPTEISQNDKSSNSVTTPNKNKTVPNYQFSPAVIDSIIKTTIAKQGINNNTITTSTTASSSETTAPLVRPRFSLPQIVSGYTQGKINSYATVNINKTDFNQSEFIELTTDFFNSTNLDKITPLFVDIVKRKNGNSVYQIWSDQYKPTGTKTKVKLSSSFPPDIYELTIGFYLIDELNSKYPPLYSKKFTITIR